MTCFVFLLTIQKRDVNCTGFKGTGNAVQPAIETRLVPLQSALFSSTLHLTALLNQRAFAKNLIPLCNALPLSFLRLTRELSQGNLKVSGSDHGINMMLATAWIVVAAADTNGANCGQKEIILRGKAASENKYFMPQRFPLWSKF